MSKEQDLRGDESLLRQRLTRVESENNRLKEEVEKLTGQIFAEAPVMYLMLSDRQGQPVIKDCNSLFLRTLGYHRDDLIGRNLADFYTPESRDLLFSSGGYEQTRRGGIFEAERQLVTSTGRVIDVLLRATPACAMFVDVTERKRLETTLQEKQRYLATLMGNLPGMVYACRGDSHWSMEFVSNGSRELTGYPPEDLIGNRRISYGQLVHETDRDLVRQKIQSALRNQKRFRVTYRITTADGRRKWVREQGQLVDEAEATHQVLEGFITDITDRVQAEETLRKTNRMLRLLSECNQTLVREADESNLMKEVCRNIVELGGYRMTWVGYADQDREKTIRPVAQWGYEREYLNNLKISWADNDRGSGPSGRSIRTREPVIIQNILTDPDYAVWRNEAIAQGYGSTAAFPLQDEGRPVGVLRIYDTRPDAFDEEEVRLLTELANDLAYGIKALRTREQHRRAEAELRKNSARLQTMHNQVRLRARELEASLNALQENEERLRVLVETLPEGVCLLDEGGALVTANAAVKACLSPLTGVETPEKINALAGLPLEDLLDQCKDGIAREIVMEGPPRQTFDISAQPIRVGNVENGCVLVIRDTTQQREIESRVQEQYRLASVGQLAAGIAHDFNNMLTVMTGTAQLLSLNPATPDTLKNDLKSICAQGQRASQLVRQILDFSRKTVIQRQPLNIVPLLKESAKLLTTTIPENIRITLESDSTDYTVIANPVQLQQMITNLAVNARDAMPRGGALAIHLSALELAEGTQPPLPEMSPGKWLVWRVSDTGTGIDPGIIKHIFEPFFTTKQPGKGTGLGLAQVYGIVKQHEGEIEVTCEPNDGATFTIYLPLSEQAPADPLLSAEKPPRGRGETILVVEDEPGVLKVARYFLESLNYKVLTAPNGKEALERYARHREEIRLVLTDMIMPEMGGGELFAALKKRDPGIQVIVMTGYITGTEEDTALLDQVAARLDKPLAFNTMAETISRILYTQSR